MSLSPPAQISSPLDRPALLTVEYQGRRFLVEDPETFRTHVALTRNRNLLQTARPASAPPPSNETGLEALRRHRPLLQPLFDVHGLGVPASYSLTQWQTPIRDQKDRDTCWAFAALAALEAAYMRGYGLTLDLSEQYFFHICRATALHGDYMTTADGWESDTSFWGAGGNSGSINSLEPFWVPLEGLAPYQTQADLLNLSTTLGAGMAPWPPPAGFTQEQIDLFEWDDRLIPRVARWNCVHGVTQTAPLADLSIEAIKATLRSNHEVVVDVSVKFKTDTDGRVIYDATSGGGGHVFVIVGYDDNDVDGTFTVKNSWGGNSFIRVAYDFFRHGDAYFGGHFITGIVPPGAAPQQNAWWLGRWNQDHDGWRGTQIIRRFGDPSSPTKIGNYYQPDGTRHDVNGFMDWYGRHAAFWIAPNSAKVQPGTPAGQQFSTYVFSWEPANAAGTTNWSNIPYGVQLCLDPIASTPARPFIRDLWLGVWNMDHDGWRGQLHIGGFGNPGLFDNSIPVVASYVPNGGLPVQAQASLWTGAQHRMNLTILFPGNTQSFDIYHHTWEADVFSGTTQWGGMTFGVRGHR